MTHTLDLTSAPTVLFFFGISGAGKSYVGDVIGEQADWFVYHADDDITSDMKNALAHQRPFTDDMRDTFFALISERIIHLHKQHKKLIITQGAYKQKHRDYLLSKIPDMEMVWVDAPQELILPRLGHRKDGITPASAAALIRDFEAPSQDCKVLRNIGDADCIIDQLNRYYCAPSKNT
jgi:gluconate kinase